MTIKKYYLITGAIVQHTQAQTIVQPHVSVQTSIPPTSTVQSPSIGRQQTPALRQSLHISPAKSSLSHVVIQQRQIIPPNVQKTTAPVPISTISSISSNLSAVGKSISTNVSATATKLSSSIKPIASHTIVVQPSQKPEVEHKEAAVSEQPPSVVSFTGSRATKPTATVVTTSSSVTPSTLISTQLPQTSKQIVFETKLQHKSITETKTSEVSKEEKQQDSSKMSVQPPTIQISMEQKPIIVHPKPIEPTKPEMISNQPVISISYNLDGSSIQTKTTFDASKNVQTVLTSNVSHMAEKRVEENIEKTDRATTSVISSVKTIQSLLEETKATEGASIEKKDSEFWSAKDVNIDSVIKKVDALCAPENEANEIARLEAKEPPKPETSKNADEKDAKDDVEPKADSKADGKNQTKREKSARNKKASPAESMPILQQEAPKPTPNVLAAPEVPVGGVQTRRGVTNKAASVPKRGRGGRNTSPRSTTQATIISGSESKPRNTNSESDIYEFHEDSGEETHDQRTRTLPIAKPHGNNQPPSPAAGSQQIEQTANRGAQRETWPIPMRAGHSSAPIPLASQRNADESTPDDTTVECEEAANTSSVPSTAQRYPIDLNGMPTASRGSTVPVTTTVVTLPEPESKPITTTVTPAPDNEKPVEQQDSSDAKEDAAALNLRKSRRLIERDGSRSTIDDIIEDVVKNATTKETSTVITSSAAVSTLAQPRRSTRNTTSLQTATKLPTVEKVDVRKSPRPNRNAKERKISEFEELAGAKEEHPNEFAAHEEKRVESNVDTRIEAEVSAIRVDAGESVKNDGVQPATKEVIVAEQPKVIQMVPTSAADAEKKPPPPRVPSEPMALIDPVTGELTVVQQSNEGQYVPVVSSHAGPIPEAVIKQSMVQSLQTPVSELRPNVEIVTTAAPKVSTPPVVTIINKPATIQTSISSVPPTSVLQMQKPHVSITSSAASSLPSTTFVITSKPVDLQTHILPPALSSEKQKPLSPAHSQIQIQPIASPSPSMPSPLNRSHPMKSHVLSTQISKVSQAPVISNASTPVILSTSAPSVSNMQQPVIKSTTIVHSTASSQKYTKDTPTSVIAQQPQYPPKHQIAINPNVTVTSQMQAPHKNTLIVNIPTSSPINMPPTHSPRLSPNTSLAKIHSQQQQLHEPQYTIHATKHSVPSMQHQQPAPQQVLPQPPVVIQSNKIHLPVTSTNYTSVVQSSGKIIQTPPSHHIKTIQQTSADVAKAHMIPKSMMSGSQAGPVPLQHMPQSQNIQSSKPAGHQMTIQATSLPQPPPFVHSIPMQYTTSKQSQRSHQTIQQIATSQHIMSPQIMPSAAVINPPPTATKQSFQQQPTPSQQQMPQPQSSQVTKTVIGLHQAPQIMTGAVASPPLKQPHLSSQQPIVTGNFHFFFIST